MHLKGYNPLDANSFSKMKTDMEGKLVTYKAMLGEKVINKVNMLIMMKLGP